MKLILASASPQRKILLQGITHEFIVCPSTVDESTCTERDPRTRSLLLSQLKAQDVRKQYTGCVVIGCDTLVVASDGTLLEKPQSSDDARRMLHVQRGAVSLVHSGVTVISAEGAMYSDVSTSSVHFSSLTSEQIDAWIASGQWKDRSGGFQIDGKGQMLIEHIEGDWTGIVGLPIYLLSILLKTAGVPIEQYLR